MGSLLEFIGFRSIMLLLLTAFAVMFIMISVGIIPVKDMVEMIGPCQCQSGGNAIQCVNTDQDNSDFKRQDVYNRINEIIYNIREKLNRGNAIQRVNTDQDNSDQDNSDQDNSDQDNSDQDNSDQDNSDFKCQDVYNRINEIIYNIREKLNIVLGHFSDLLTNLLQPFGRDVDLTKIKVDVETGGINRAPDKK